MIAPQTLPDGWEIKIIKRSFTIQLGKMLQNEAKSDADTYEYYLRAANVGWPGVDISDIRQMWLSPDEKGSLRLRKGDLLVCEGGDVGRSAIWNEEIGECYIQNAINRVRARHDADNRFLFYWLFFLKEQGYIDTIVSRITIAHLTAEKLARILFISPPVEEQRRIAAFLDQQCAAIDGAIAVKQQQLEKFDTLGKTVLSKAVLEGLDDNAPKRNPHSLWFSEIPAHWDIRRLKDVSTMQTGITLGKDYDEPTEERPYLRVANVQDGHLALDDMKTINLPPTLIPRYELQPGDVLMTEGGDLDKLGRGYVWNNELPGCLHQNHVFALRCQPQKLLPDYLAMLTSSTHGRAYFEITGKKTTNLASTNATKVNLFPIPLPPIEEQARIVAWVKAELDKIQQARAVVNRQVEVLAEYKKSLIHECVTGKRRVVV